MERALTTIDNSNCWICLPDAVQPVFVLAQMSEHRFLRVAKLPKCDVTAVNPAQILSTVPGKELKHVLAARLPIEEVMNPAVNSTMTLVSSLITSTVSAKTRNFFIMNNK